MMRVGRSWLASGLHVSTPSICWHRHVFVGKRRGTSAQTAMPLPLTVAENLTFTSVLSPVEGKSVGTSSQRLTLQTTVRCSLFWVGGFKEVKIKCPGKHLKHTWGFRPDPLPVCLGSDPGRAPSLSVSSRFVPSVFLSLSYSDPWIQINKIQWSECTGRFPRVNKLFCFCQSFPWIEPALKKNLTHVAFLIKSFSRYWIY